MLKTSALTSTKTVLKNLVPWSHLITSSCKEGHEYTIEDLKRQIIKVIKDENLPPKGWR
ncbi:MAG: hypothetical protein R2880_08680 [Deinococcales bacterium]